MTTRQAPAAESGAPGYDRNNPGRTAPRLVNHQLAHLGLGETYPDGQRTIPVGTGWCRALPVPEEAWPAAAELCVIVDWYPDEAYQRDTRKNRTPAGADAHWQNRIAATTEALRSIGYVAEQCGPPRTPNYHPRAELLVYRMPPGVPAPAWPANAWPSTPARPVFNDRPSYPTPREMIDDTLRTAQISYADYRAGRPCRAGAGCVARSITQSLWPPSATACALVMWHPDPDHVGDLADHWETGTALVTQALNEAGLETRRRERPWNPGVEESADFLVYKR